MKKLLFALFCCLAVAAITLAQDPLSPAYMPSIDTNAADYPANIWVTDTMQKVLQTGGTPGTSHWGTFYGTQGEFVDFQVHVQAPANGYSALTVSSSSFVQSAPSSFTIPAPSTSANNIVVYREAYLNITTLSSTGAVYYNATGYYPDPMIPAIDPYYHQVTNAFPVAVTGNYNQSAWIDVFIPQNALSGYYLGSITVSNGSTTLATLPIIIGVWQWPSAQGGHMPATSTLPSTTQYGWADFCNAAYGNTTTCSTNNTASDGAVMFMDHRWTMNDPIQGSAAQQTMQFNGSTSGVTTAHPIIPGASTSSANYRCNNCGFGSTPQAFATTFGSMKYPSGSNGTYPLITPFYYTSDEPGVTAANWTSLCALATTSHATTPPVPTLITGFISAMNANSGTSGCTTQGVTNSVDIIVVPNFCLYPIGEYICSAGEGSAYPSVGNNRSSYNSWLSHSNPDGITPSLWDYVACGGAGTCGGVVGGLSYPNYNVDSMPTGNRAVEWMDYLYQETGELYYYTTGVWEQNPMTTANDPWTTLYNFGQNGDGTLAYPSSWEGGSIHHVTLQSGSPLTMEIWIPRLVLKQMRDGMQDWEYLHVLTNMGFGSYVTTQVQSWITNSNTYETTGSGLQAARYNLGTKLHQQTYSTVLLPPPSLSGTVQP
jgi:Domain of unknown function (DUF4091)